MAITATISQAELQRVAELAYEGWAVRVSLANDVVNSLTAQSTVAACDALKISGNGYVDFYGKLSTGSYDSVDARYELPYVDAVYSGTGAGYSYNTIYVVLGSLTSVPISTIAVSTNVVTVTTSSPHGLITGDRVNIDTSSTTVYEGFYVVTGTPDSTSFTFNAALPNVSATVYTGTVGKYTENVNLHSLLVENPLKLIAAGQTQTYRILFATDN